MPLRSVALALFLIGLAGCGRSTAKVTGKVSLNGDPITAGIVSAINEKGESAANARITDEGFQLEGLPPGNYTLTVVTFRHGGMPAIPVAGLPPEKSLPPVGADKLPMLLEKMANEEGKKVLARLKPIPNKYMAYGSSGFTVALPGGRDVKMDLEMTGKGEVPPALPTGKGKGGRP